MKKTSDKIMIAMFITVLFSIAFLNILLPDKGFSELENRRLEQLPELNWKSIKNGRFSKKFETYITDQFIYKDFFVSIKSDVERLILKNENNGVFFGKDGYLLEHYRKPNEQIDKNIDNINKFANKLPNVSTHLLLVPNSVKVYKDKLPPFASPYDQRKTLDYVKERLIKNIDVIDVYDRLKRKKDQYIYFKTDHHWTMRGAYYGYQVLGEHLGIRPYNMSDFYSEIVSDSFYGTFYAKANNRNISPDFIEIFQPKFDVKYNVHYQDNNKNAHTLYQFNHLDKRDKYAVFLDGNHPLIKIKTNINNNKKLVIFKDSYAHTVIPFLANHYEEIHVIDLRYYKLSVYAYIQENEINEALFLYNVSTFSTDGNIILK